MSIDPFSTRARESTLEAFRIYRRKKNISSARRRETYFVSSLCRIKNKQATIHRKENTHILQFHFLQAAVIHFKTFNVNTIQSHNIKVFVRLGEFYIVSVNGAMYLIKNVFYVH